MKTQNETKSTILLQFKSGEVSLPVRKVSYAATAEILAEREKFMKNLSDLDELYEGVVIEEPNEAKPGENKLVVVDAVGYSEKLGRVRLEEMNYRIKVAKIIAVTKGIPTEQKEEIMSDEFWADQDYAGEIAPAVDSFCQTAGV